MRGLFHYSKYWRRWALILSHNGVWTEEVALTAINPQFPESWAQIDGKVRRHCSPLDNTTAFLPADARAEMIRHLGREKTSLLLSMAD